MSPRKERLLDGVSDPHGASVVEYLTLFAMLVGAVLATSYVTLPSRVQRAAASIGCQLGWGTGTNGACEANRAEAGQSQLPSRATFAAVDEPYARTQRQLDALDRRGPQPKTGSRSEERNVSDWLANTFATVGFDNDGDSLFAGEEANTQVVSDDGIGHQSDAESRSVGEGALDTTTGDANVEAGIGRGTGSTGTSGTQVVHLQPRARDQSLVYRYAGRQFGVRQMPVRLSPTELAHYRAVERLRSEFEDYTWGLSEDEQQELLDRAIRVLTDIGYSVERAKGWEGGSAILFRSFPECGSARRALCQFGTAVAQQGLSQTRIVWDPSLDFAGLADDSWLFGKTMYLNSNHALDSVTDGLTTFNHEAKHFELDSSSPYAGYIVNADARHGGRNWHFEEVAAELAELRYAGDVLETAIESVEKDGSMSLEQFMVAYEQPRRSAGLTHTQRLTDNVRVILHRAANAFDETDAEISNIRLNSFVATFPSVHLWRAVKLTVGLNGYSITNDFEPGIPSRFEEPVTPSDKATVLQIPLSRHTPSTIGVFRSSVARRRALRAIALDVKRRVETFEDAQRQRFEEGRRIVGSERRLVELLAPDGELLAPDGVETD